MLDFSKLATKISGLRPLIMRKRDERSELLDKVSSAFAEMPDKETLTTFLTGCQNSWRPAYPIEEPGVKYDIGLCNDGYRVVAVDSSQLVPGRHDAIPFYIINVGQAVIGYGDKPYSKLSSQPDLADLDEMKRLYAVEYDIELQSESFIAEQRLEYELRSLINAAKEIEPPAIVYYDGSIILWSLQSTRPEKRRNEIVGQLLNFFRVCLDNSVFPVGYISRPGSRDVVNNLAMLNCGREPINCMQCRKDYPDMEDRPCSMFVRVTDGELFSRILKKGERSAVFENRTTDIIRDSYMVQGGPQYAIQYCYIHNGYEVARLEFPAFLSGIKGAVEQLVSITFDQCSKGKGYPRALGLAHEYALIDGGERSAFINLVEGMALPYLASPKEMAKRRRGI